MNQMELGAVFKPIVKQDKLLDFLGNSSVPRIGIKFINDRILIEYDEA